MADPIIIDDSDSTVVYSPLSQWTPGGVSNELDGTTHSASSAGATATVTFSGTLVAVYGTIDVIGDSSNPFNPVSSYIIDGSIIANYTGERSPNLIQYRKLFFQSPTLSAGDHTLVINNTVNQGRLILDYVLYVPIVAPKTSVTIAGSSSAAQSTTTSTLGQSSGSSGSKGIPIGVLVGVAVGAVVVILIMFFFIWRLSRTSNDLKRSHELLVEKMTANPSNSQQDVFAARVAASAPQNIQAERVVMPFYSTGVGYTTRREKASASARGNNTTPSRSTSRGVGAANTSESTLAASGSRSRPSPPSPPHHHIQRSGGTHPDHQPRGRGPAYLQSYHGQDPLVESPPSYQIGTPAPIDREGV